MSKLTQNILAKIKTEHITPHSRWRFLLKRWFYWGLCGFSVIVGSIATSVMLFEVVHLDWDVYEEVGGGFVPFFMSAMPYVWILVLILFIFVAYINFRHTEKGYRYHGFLIIAASVIASLIFGSILFATGLSEKFERGFLNIPHYEQLRLGRERLWMNPENGLLVGKIMQFVNESSFTLRDIDGADWEVDALEAEWKVPYEPQEGMNVKMRGDRIDDDSFTAREIRIVFPSRHERREDVEEMRRFRVPPPPQRLPGKRPPQMVP